MTLKGAGRRGRGAGGGRREGSICALPPAPCALRPPSEHGNGGARRRQIERPDGAPPVTRHPFPVPSVVAHHSLCRNNVMKSRSNSDRRCSYVVVHEDETASPDDLRSFAHHLSTLAVAGCEVIVVDDTASVDRNRRIFRWVGRHVAALPRHRALSGAVDPLRAAQDLASCEKI